MLTVLFPYKISHSNNGSLFITIKLKANTDFMWMPCYVTFYKIIIP